MENADIKRVLSRVPAIPDERYEQVWRAIAERTISEKQQDRIRVSALIDGELPDSQRVHAEQCLADHPELAESTAIWKKLAAATKALPVPKISEMAARATALKISQRTQAMSEKVRLASETLSAASKTPSVSHERWQQVWSGIEHRIQDKAQATHASKTAAPAPVRKVTPIRRWRWVLAATAAAAAIAMVATLQLGDTEDPKSVASATKVPNAVDERYESSLEVVNGQAVVCFYLKPQTSGEPGGDSRWLPD